MTAVSIVHEKKVCVELAEYSFCTPGKYQQDSGNGTPSVSLPEKALRVRDLGSQNSYEKPSQIRGGHS